MNVEGREEAPRRMPALDPVQAISLLGALLILGAFSANQVGFLSTHRVAYNAMNFFGALILAWVAVVSAQYGFIVLEGAWAAISLVALLRARRRSSPDEATHSEGSVPQ
jgi:hypothetical protein